MGKQERAGAYLERVRATFGDLNSLRNASAITAIAVGTARTALGQLQTADTASASSLAASQRDLRKGGGARGRCLAVVLKDRAGTTIPAAAWAHRGERALSLVLRGCFACAHPLGWAPGLRAASSCLKNFSGMHAVGGGGEE